MKKLALGILIAALMIGTACADGENLLKNGGFEEINASGIPDDWYTGLLPRCGQQHAV